MQQVPFETIGFVALLIATREYPAYRDQAARQLTGRNLMDRNLIGRNADCVFKFALPVGLPQFLVCRTDDGSLEICDDNFSPVAPQYFAARTASGFDTHQRHDVRSFANQLVLALYLYNRFVKEGKPGSAGELFGSIQSTIEELCDYVSGTVAA